MWMCNFGWILVFYILVIVYINLRYCGDKEEEIAQESGVSPLFVASTFERPHISTSITAALASQNFEFAFTQRTHDSSSLFKSNGHGVLPLALSVQEIKQKSSYALSNLKSTLTHWTKGTKPYQWSAEDNSIWQWEGYPKENHTRSSTRSESAKRRAKGKWKGKKGRGKGQAQQAQTMSPSPFQSQTTFSAWPSPETTLQASTSQTQAPVAPDSFATSSSSTTAAAPAGHIELVTVVRKQYPDIGKAPSDIQAAVKKADQALSKQLGSDLHKASTQITKAPKQLNTLRDAKNKHRESWLRHLKDSVTGWENQIKAFQEQQKQYMDQINKAKAEIQATRRSLQTV